MGEPTVRDTQAGDMVALETLVDAVARERRYLAATAGFGLDSTREFFESVRRNHGVHLVAESAGAIVGWCDVARGGLETMAHAGHLGMGVAAAYRGRGLGRRLIERAIAAAWEAGIERVELEVFAGNAPAVALYRKVGFLEEGRKRRARKPDGAFDDVLVFGLLRELPR